MERQCVATREVSKDALEEMRMLVHTIAVKYPVAEIYLFGSRARGEESSDSDYDFLVVPKDHMSAFQFCGMLCDLEEQFGAVDLVSSRSINDEFERSVMDERILIYGE